jgi:tetratricopeptide (TPR) repeat protein
MRVKAFGGCLGLAIWLGLAGTVCAQDIGIDSKYKTADTNNAVIEGRVSLPSGFAANRSFRITLKNSTSVLSVFYSNSHGEFRIANLSEGYYYVQAELDDGSFEPAVESVALGRGIVTKLNLELREKKSPQVTLNLGPRVVSLAELHQVVPRAAKREYELGLKSAGKGDIAEAAAHFQQAVTLFPEYLAARNDLGAQYLKLKRLDEAEQHFRIVLAADSKNFNAKFNLGLVRVERRDYLGAISELNEAIAIDSSRPVARLWRGFAYLELGDVAAAERELTAALVMGGAECVAAHYHLARIYLSRGDIAEAARAVRAYLEESPRGEYVKEARQLEGQLAGREKARPQQ